MISEVAGIVFANGPVQNGDFTLADKPGKAAGIRIAEALNQLLGTEPAPQLWNTVTLSGDLRHRALQEHAADAHTASIHGVWAAYGQVERGDFERQLVAAKYPPGAAPHVWTDVDAPVAATALAMVEHGLAVGDLVVETIEVRACASCGHLAGLTDRPCRACGHQTTRGERARHLLARRRDGARPVDAGDFHAHARRAPAHLLSVAANAPEVLLLSRTRDHGVRLDPIGLPGLVLDPRAGLHAAVLAVAAERGWPVEQVVMTTTENAAANIAAYGACFRTHQGIRLRYGLHGRIPYEQAPTLNPAYAALRLDDAARDRFEHWFLPLASWHYKNDIGPGQLPALLRLFHRARLAPAGPDAALATLRAQIAAGDTRWLTDKHLLAAAVHHATRR